jgi:septal ring factor EnvC (AmiA/AmiB activator)
MTTYRIEMMARGDYHEYMMGGNNYWVRKVDIEANTADEAVEIAKKNNPEMVINTDYVRTVAELEEMASKRKAQFEAFLKAEEERKANAKARKEERERAKAEALGLTVEEYKAKRTQEKRAANLREKIANLEKELARAKKALAKLEEGI